MNTLRDGVEVLDVDDAPLCPAPECVAPVPFGGLVCTAHWLALPLGLRNQIWRAFEDGDERTERMAGLVSRAVAFLRSNAAGAR